MVFAGCALEDGRHLLTVATKSTKRPFDWELFSSPVDGGESVSLGVTGLKWGASFSVHPNGRRIAFDKGKSDYELWVVKNLFGEKKAAR